MYVHGDLISYRYRQERNGFGQDLISIPLSVVNRSRLAVMNFLQREVYN